MSQLAVEQADPAAPVLHGVQRNGPLLLVCEHASSHIPPHLDHLGLSPDARSAHVAWDPGAIALALQLAELLDAKLVASGVSRLVCDCNRAPDAADLMPARSERFDVPGNVNLAPPERERRLREYYWPFHELIEKTIASFTAPPALVTVHSFTPVYDGRTREVDIGIVHDDDARLADALLRSADAGTLRLRRNQPYGPQDGVTHTLRRHGMSTGLLNVMIEVRNDLIATDAQRGRLAHRLAQWLSAALDDLTDDTRE